MKKSLLLSALLVLAFSLNAQASSISYTSSAAFFAALTGSTVATETYEGLGLNSTIADGSTVNGITYNTFPAGSDGRIDNLYNRIGNRSLALQRGGDATAFFIAGDAMTVTFPFAVNAVGIFFNVGQSGLNTLQVLTSAGNAGNGAAYDQSTLYFVGLIADTTFTSATFGGTTPATGWNLDNLSYSNSLTAAVPEPASMTLLVSGLAGFGVRRWRRRKA